MIFKLKTVILAIVLVSAGALVVTWNLSKTPSNNNASPQQSIEQQKSTTNNQEETIQQPQPTNTQQQPQNSQTLSGNYRCWSFNNSRYGGTSCRNPPQPALVINSDGTYSLSSEHGTYKIQGNQIILSESKIRGPGTLLENNMQIRFEYDYNGSHYTVTYLKDQ